jgi:hypothetical protein
MKKRRGKRMGGDARGRRRIRDSVLPVRSRARMNHDDKQDGPLLPERDPQYKILGRTLYLERWLWDALDAMVVATNADMVEKKDRFSRNELIEFYLKAAHERWKNRSMTAKKPTK